MYVVCIEETSPQCLYFIWFYLCYFFPLTYFFRIFSQFRWFVWTMIHCYNSISKKKPIKILWTILIHLFLFNLLFLDEKNNEITKSSSFSCLSDNSIDVGVWRRIFVYIFFIHCPQRVCARGSESERVQRVSHTCVRIVRVFVCECSFYSSIPFHVWVSVSLYDCISTYLRVCMHSWECVYV